MLCLPHVSMTMVCTLIGYVTVRTSFGELTGPLVGGIVYDFGGHWSVCAVAMTVVGVDIVLRGFLWEHNDQNMISAPDAGSCTILCSPGQVCIESLCCEGFCALPACAECLCLPNRHLQAKSRSYRGQPPIRVPARHRM